MLVGEGQRVGCSPSSEHRGSEVSLRESSWVIWGVTLINPCLSTCFLGILCFSPKVDGRTQSLKWSFLPINFSFPSEVLKIFSIAFVQRIENIINVAPGSFGYFSSFLPTWALAVRIVCVRVFIWTGVIPQEVSSANPVYVSECTLSISALKRRLWRNLINILHSMHEEPDVRSFLLLGRRGEPGPFQIYRNQCSLTEVG